MSFRFFQSIVLQWKSRTRSTIAKSWQCWRATCASAKWLHLEKCLTLAQKSFTYFSVGYHFRIQISSSFGWLYWLFQIRLRQQNIWRCSRKWISRSSSLWFSFQWQILFSTVSWSNLHRRLTLASYKPLVITPGSFLWCNQFSRLLLHLL